MRYMLHSLWAAIVGCVLSATPAHAADVPAPGNLKPIGGKWYVQEGPKPVYFYKDADRYVDLFSYHTKDSNKDGIENVRLRNDRQFLLMDSQGYPNHPTAVFPNSGNPNRIEVQDFHFKIPLEPKFSPDITRVPMGPRCWIIASAQLPVCWPINRALSSRCSRLC